MNKSARISRRTALRGLGTTLALPLLDCMTPRLGWGKDAPATPPRRMAFVVVPNGKHMPAWTPTREGAQFDLPSILEPLAPYQQDLLVLTNLAQRNASALGDGGGDHARSAATFLTGVHPRKTNGANIQAGVSVDQLAAQKLGQTTRFPSLEIGCDKAMYSGSCDSGYSCAYQSNVSWRSESTPTAKEHNPRLLFERLFSGSNSAEAAESRAKRALYRNSILDYVAADAAQLHKRLGGADRRKLDEYLTSVREIERQLEKTSAENAVQDLPKYQRPDGIPKDYEQHIRLMHDMLVLALQADLTRVATFLVANEGSNRSYPQIGVSESHHDLSHHGGDKEKQDKIRQINRFHTTQLAYLLGKLKAVREHSGTLLDQCMVVYGSGISDGDRHNHNDLPILLAGRGGGTIRPGRHVRYERDTPLNNLFLSMLERVDVAVERLGDSTGRLSALDA